MAPGPPEPESEESGCYGKLPYLPLTGERCHWRWTVLPPICVRYKDM